MEKRFYLGVGLLVAFLLLCVLVAVVMEKTQIPIAQDLKQAAQAAQQGDLQKATALAKGAEDAWKQGWHGVAALADHDPMDQIDGLFAQMEYYAQAEESVAFGACCARLSALVEAVADDHSFTWWNLL